MCSNEKGAPVRPKRIIIYTIEIIIYTSSAAKM